MKNYLEQDFEEHIEESLVSSGYTTSDPSIYDKTLCLLPTKLIGFIQETQRTELLKEYRQSLISEVVTGKIDVRDYNG